MLILTLRAYYVHAVYMYKHFFLLIGSSYTCRNFFQCFAVFTFFLLPRRTEVFTVHVIDFEETHWYMYVHVHEAAIIR